jgi:hypothetical protein
MAVVHRTAIHRKLLAVHGIAVRKEPAAFFPEIAVSLSKSVSITFLDACVKFTIYFFSVGHRLSWTGIAQPV